MHLTSSSPSKVGEFYAISTEGAQIEQRWLVQAGATRNGCRRPG